MISVICPIFDFDNLLKENIISVLNQEFNNFELILINFHSNKKLNNILECFKQKDKRIKVICPLVNQDSSDFVNECIKNAKGKYIYFWDYHFYLSKNAFKSLFESAEKNYLDYLVFNYSVDVDGILFLQYDISNDYICFGGDNHKFIFDYLISKGNNFILKSFLINNIYFNGDFHDFFFKLKFNSKRGLVLNNPLAVVQKQRVQLLEESIQNVEEIIAIFDWFLINRDLFEYYKVDLIKFLLVQLRNYHDSLINFDLTQNLVSTFIHIKKNFINKIICLFDKMYYDFELYDDIKNLSDNGLLDFFDMFLVNKSKFRLSIVIPIYNNGKYLKDTFNSIIHQTLNFESIEVILIDDCSTDDSASIIREYSDKYPNFKSFFLDKNSNYAGKPRNIGLNNISSNFVTFLDADDYYYENACEDLYFSMICHNADVIIGNFTVDTPDGNKRTVIDAGIDFFSNLNQFDTIAFNSIKNNPHILNSANVWNKLFNVNIIKKNNIQFLEGIPAQDSAFLFEFFIKSNDFVFINEIITHYHNLRNSIDDQSVTHRRNKLNITGRLEAYNFMYNLSLGRDIEEYFVKNLLINKLTYLFVHIKDTDLSIVDIKEIFEKYDFLFNACLKYDGIVPKKYVSIFDNIYNSNFEGISDNLNKL